MENKARDVISRRSIGSGQMNYRSISDLYGTIVAGLHRLPPGIDLVVGIPRSGLLAANIFGLIANVPIADLDSFVDGKVFSFGTTKNTRSFKAISEITTVLVLDDSLNTGNAMREARAKIEASGRRARFIYAVVYALEDQPDHVDFVFEVVEQPRLFQWNFMHHGLLSLACVDIDGVLCVDPTDEENDDGPAYEHFLQNAPCLYKPTRFIAYLVTNRLEKYRHLTEAWLRRNAIEYGRLVMLDLPSAAERRRHKAHGRFKGDFYRDCSAEIFIESSLSQAREIARLSKKPVLCTEVHQMVLPPTYRGFFNLGFLSRFAAAAAPEAAVAPDFSYTIADPKSRSQSRTLISWLGQRPENFADAVETVRKTCHARNEFPVILLSDFHQKLMAQTETPVEVLPEAGRLAMLSSDQYQTYVNRRWDIILQKWGISREVTLGMEFDEFLAEQAARLPAT